MAGTIIHNRLQELSPQRDYANQKKSIVATFKPMYNDRMASMAARAGGIIAKAKMPMLSASTIFVILQISILTAVPCL